MIVLLHNFGMFLDITDFLLFVSQVDINICPLKFLFFITLQMLWFNSGLDNFSPQEDHTNYKDSPEGRFCLQIYRKGGGGEFIFIRAIILCLLDCIYC